MVIPDLSGNPKDRVIEKLRNLGLTVELFEEEFNSRLDDNLDFDPSRIRFIVE